MIELKPPKVTAVEVHATQPTDGDRSTLARLAERSAEPLPDVVYVVKIAFESMPPVTSEGWALYVGEERIPKYWAYKGGIYFKVFDSDFLANHNGEAVRFSLDGATFVETGKKLINLKAKALQAAKAAVNLPTQTDVLR